MDGQRFDDLTRRFAVTVSRRAALKAVVGGLAAGLLASVREAGARKPCATSADCRNSNLVCIDGVCCGGAARCNNDTVCCPRGQWCTDDKGCCPSNDVCHDVGMNYCCGPCMSCAGGVCTPQCSTLCEECVNGQCKDNGRCVSCQGAQPGPAGTFDVKPAQVIQCGPCEECDPDQGCVPKACDLCAPCDATTGSCVPITCPAGQEPDPANNCACACAPVSCPEGQVQNPETCACECSDGTMDCGGACIDTTTDLANCGTCGTACSEGETCCQGSCVDTTTDSTNCGTCGTACGVGETCTSGSCESDCEPITCPEGQTQNAETCQCECSGFQTGCDPNEICEDGTCVAVCLDTSGGGVHNGTFVACSDENGTFIGCFCNSCGTTCNHSGGYACCSDGCQYVVTTCEDMGH